MEVKGTGCKCSESGSPALSFRAELPEAGWRGEFRLPLSAGESAGGVVAGRRLDALVLSREPWLEGLRWRVRDARRVGG